jgi:oligoendopeptidase F
MKNKVRSVIAVVCLLALLLTGCGPRISNNLEDNLDKLAQKAEQLQAQQTEPTRAQEEEPTEEPTEKPDEEPTEEPTEAPTEEAEFTHYDDMEYTRPDMEELEEALDAVCQAAEDGDLDEIVDGIYEFYDLYDWFYTNLSLADIRCSADLTDEYWNEEYSFCMEASSRVDAALEELYYALAASPCREELEGEDYFGEGYFDSYEGENPWGEEYTQLLQQESELTNLYYELSTVGLEYDYSSDEYYEACGDEMMELLVELIRVRQEIAAYWGYDDYTQYATDAYYYRDYTPRQMEKYLKQIRKELVPLYTDLYWTVSTSGWTSYSSEKKTFAYVRDAAKAMGGTVEEAFDLMEKAGLYDISYGKNKYNSSFEVYLTSYEEPYLFVNPEKSTYDHLTFAHEFGHFCNDYASYGSSVGVDVLEVFSQGMEFLSLCYGDANEKLLKLKMWDCLSLFVEQAAFASFELQMYDLKDDELTVENLRKLYDQVAKDYGFETMGYDDREFITINHYYTHPMYIISYIVSNDTALQIYQLEQEEPGAGLKCYEENLDTEQYYFLEFLEEAGLESPFDSGRIEWIRETFEDVF